MYIYFFRLVPSSSKVVKSNGHAERCSKCFSAWSVLTGTAGVIHATLIHGTAHVREEQANAHQIQALVKFSREFFGAADNAHSSMVEKSLHATRKVEQTDKKRNSALPLAFEYLSVRDAVGQTSALETDSATLV